MNLLGVSKRPVELLDIYPTLVELAGLPKQTGLEGESLRTLLRDPQAPRQRPAITGQMRGNFAVRSEHWRYIRYADGSEELYDHRNDPNEFTNLANRPAFAATKAEHARWLPQNPAAPAPGAEKTAGGFLDYVNGRAYFNGQPLDD